MSVVGNNRIGIPLILLHDGEGAIITVETKRGDMYRGFLFEAQETMNLIIKKVRSPGTSKRSPKKKNKKTGKRELGKARTTSFFFFDPLH